MEQVSFETMSEIGDDFADTLVADCYMEQLTVYVNLTELISGNERSYEIKHIGVSGQRSLIY